MAAPARIGLARPSGAEGPIRVGLARLPRTVIHSVKYGKRHISTTDRRWSSKERNIVNSADTAQHVVSATPGNASPGNGGYSAEQLAFLERKEAQAAPRTNGSTPVSSPPPAPTSSAQPSSSATGNGNGFSAEQLAFLDRKKTEAPSSAPATSPDAAPQPSPAPEPAAPVACADVPAKQSPSEERKEPKEPIAAEVSGGLHPKATSGPRVLGLGYVPVKIDTAQRDPGLNQQLISSGHTISMLWTQDMWERHRDVTRYWRHLAAVPRSNIFNRCLETVTLITSGAVLLALWNTFAPGLWGLPALSLSPITHSVSGSLLSLMLVFRTNNANARVNEGRALLATMVKCMRDLVRFSLYVPQQAGQCREEIIRYCRAFPYALLGHMRKGRSREDPDDPTAYRVDSQPHLTRILGPELAAGLVAHKDGNIPSHLLLDMSTTLHRGLTIGMSTQVHQQSELVLKVRFPGVVRRSMPWL